MTFRKTNTVAGTVGFLAAVSAALFWTYANAHNLLSLGELRILQDLTLVICPPSIGLLATEQTGIFGAAIIVAIVAVQNFAIYFLVAAGFGLVWRKLKQTRSISAHSPDLMPDRAEVQKGNRREKGWGQHALIATGIVLLASVVAGLASYVASFGWSWYYIPGPLAVLGVCLICFRAAGRIKGASPSS
jgi:hypothetical protein